MSSESDFHTSERPVKRRRDARSPRNAATSMLFALALLLPGAGRAQLLEPEARATPSELALLPEYCPDTQQFTKYGLGQSPNSAKWVGLMGETFWALHHYCWGILKFNRSQLRAYPGVIRYGLQTSALGEFAFVTRSMPEDYVLAPEIYTYIGRTHLLQHHPMEADAAFAQARRLKPDYWPAYSWWATYLANHGQRDKAREIVTEGLKHSPNAKTLQLILKDLDSAGGSPSKRAASRTSESK